MAIALAKSTGSAPYTTSFPNTENPISEGGKWLNGAADGVDWTNVRTLASTKAYGTQTGNNGLDDSIAILKDRSYNNTQYAKGTVYVAGSDTQDEEIELHLQGSIAAHSIDTYEIEFPVRPLNEGVAYINKWTGAKGSFTQEATGYIDASPYTWLSGDILRATIVNGVITVYGNNIQFLQWTDPSPYTGGAPGVGMFLGAAGGTNGNFGLSHFEGGDQVENVNGAYWGNQATSGSVATPINVTAGNTLIVVCSAYQHTPAAADLSETAGTATIGAISRDNYTGGGAGTVGLAIFSIPITGSGSLTIQFNPGVNYAAFAIAEFSGVASSPVGATDTNSGTGTAQTTHSISNTAGSLIVYVASELSTQNLLRAYSDTLLAGSNDGGSGSGSFTFGAQFKITSGTPNTLTTTWGESVNWWTCAVEYKAAAGGQVPYNPIMQSGPILAQ